MSQVIVNQTPIGGGGKLRHRAMPKMKDFCRRYYNCSFPELPKRKKLPFVYLLHDAYGFTVREIASFAGCSLSHAYRLLSDAVWMYHNSTIMQNDVHRIADYILYIAKYNN